VDDSPSSSLPIQIFRNYPSYLRKKYFMLMAGITFQ
jgi:hypothetical protein